MKLLQIALCPLALILLGAIFGLIILLISKKKVGFLAAWAAATVLFVAIFAVFMMNPIVDTESVTDEKMKSDAVYLTEKGQHWGLCYPVYYKVEAGTDSAVITGYCFPFGTAKTQLTYVNGERMFENIKRPLEPETAP